MLSSVNVVFYYVDLAGQIYVLLQLRDETKKITFPGYWAIPGGGSQEGETPEDATEREGCEETSLKINKDKLVLIKEFPSGFFYWLSKRSFFYSYRIDYNTSFLVKNGEGQKMLFFNINEVDKLKMPPEQLSIIMEIRSLVSVPTPIG